MQKTVETVIAEKKKTISKRWFQSVIATYPPQTTAFYGKEKDHFANPVAGSLSESLDQVLEGLASGAARQELAEALDAAIRVRAVQDFSASASVGFVFFLKDIVRDCLDKATATPDFLTVLDKTVDGLALIAFDKYMECREKIYNLRAYEVRNRTFKAFEKAGLVVDTEAPGPEASGH